MPSTADIDFFSTVPWVSSLLFSPTNVQFTPTCRLEAEPGIPLPTKDEFFRNKLKTDDLIPYATAFYHDFFADDVPAKQDTTLKQKQLLIEKSTLVLSLQSGTNGYNGTAHGGLIATLIDEAMGSLIFINHKVYSDLRHSSPDKIGADVLDMHGVAMFTASMNVVLKAPLPTPQIVLVEAEVQGVEGRKLFIDVRVKSREGIVFATCRGMWMSVSIKEKL